MVCGQPNVPTCLADMLFDSLSRRRVQSANGDHKHCRMHCRVVPCGPCPKLLASLSSCMGSCSISSLNFGQALPDSKAHSTPVGTLWGARATVSSIPTRPIHPVAVQALITPLELARVLASHITPTSVRLSRSSRVKLQRNIVLHTESACPNSYVYAFDESSQTALWTCPASSNADYTITFCPPSEP